MKRLDNAWMIFDTLGLALFTIVGLQKTLACGHPFWVAIIMGCMTGAAGGVIRDVLLNNVPVINLKGIYAMASIVGGLAYWILTIAHINAVLGRQSPHSSWYALSDGSLFDTIFLFQYLEMKRMKVR